MKLEKITVKQWVELKNGNFSKFKKTKGIKLVIKLNEKNISLTNMEKIETFINYLQ